MECSICVEKCKTNIVCPSCNNKDTIICKSCCERQIKTNINSPQCISCKTVWNKGVITQLMGKKFYTDLENKQFEDYLTQQYTLLEADKTMLPVIKEQEEKKEELKKIKAQKDEFRKKWQKSLRQYNNMSHDLNKLGAKIQEKPKLLLKCPKDCNGVISPESETCTECGIDVCMSCGKKIPFKRVHRCNPDDVETIKMLKKNTKNCPKCSVNIFKSDGCNQMFCTNCHTAFDWDSLKIITGGIHNPHYFELLREGKITNQNPTATNVQISNFFNRPIEKLYPEGYYEFLAAFMRFFYDRVAADYDLKIQRFNNRCKKLRENLLLEKISEEQFEKSMKSAKRTGENIRIERGYAETFNLIIVSCVNSMYKLLEETITKSLHWKDHIKNTPTAVFSRGEIYYYYINLQAEIYKKDKKMYTKFADDALDMMKDNTREIIKLQKSYDKEKGSIDNKRNFNTFFAHIGDAIEDIDD